MKFITFGRFGHIKDLKKDKEIFLEFLKELVCRLSYDKKLSEKLDDIELSKILKQIIINEQKYFWNAMFYKYISCFMEYMGLSYNTITKEEQKEVLEMDFTYENWKNKSLILFNNYKERCKRICPSDIHFCFDDKYFLIYLQAYKNSEITLNNFLRFIRDYYILEYGKELLEEFFDINEFNINRNKVIKLYPILKENYGMNRKLEKILSYVDNKNDYNFEIVRNILDNYFARKKNKNIKFDDEEKIKLKNE